MRKRDLIAAAAGALAATVLAGGVAWAAIPSEGGVYTACMLKNVGTVRLIDKSLPPSNLMSHCKAVLEIEISWNRQGPKGFRGSQGPPGPDGSTESTVSRARRDLPGTRDRREPPATRSSLRPVSLHPAKPRPVRRLPGRQGPLHGSYDKFRPEHHDHRAIRTRTDPIRAGGVGYTRCRSRTTATYRKTPFMRTMSCIGIDRGTI